MKFHHVLYNAIYAVNVFYHQYVQVLWRGTVRLPKLPFKIIITLSTKHNFSDKQIFACISRLSFLEDSKVIVKGRMT